MLDLRPDGEWPGEERRRARGVGRPQQVADTGRRDDAAIVGHGGDDRCHDAVRRPETGKVGGVTRPSRAEGEVGPGDHRACPDGRGQPAADERRTRQRGKAVVEGHDDGGVDPEGRKEVELLVGRRQRERRGLGPEDARRVGVERRDQRRAPCRPRGRQRRADHRLVAPVEAVEIAQRDDPAGQVRGHGRPLGDPLHGGCVAGGGGAVIPGRRSNSH